MKKQGGISWKVVGYVVALLIVVFLIADYMSDDIRYSPEDGEESELSTMYAPLDDGAAPSDGTTQPITTPGDDGAETAAADGYADDRYGGMCCSRDATSDNGCYVSNTDASGNYRPDSEIEAECTSRESAGNCFYAYRRPASDGGPANCAAAR